MREGQAGRQANRDTERQRERLDTEGERERDRERQRQRQTDRQTDRQRQTDRDYATFFYAYTHGGLQFLVLTEGPFIESAVHNLNLTPETLGKRKGRHQCCDHCWSCVTWFSTGSVLAPCY